MRIWGCYCRINGIVQTCAMLSGGLILDWLCPLSYRGDGVVKETSNGQRSGNSGSYAGAAMCFWKIRETVVPPSDSAMSTPYMSLTSSPASANSNFILHHKRASIQQN